MNVRTCTTWSAAIALCLLAGCQSTGAKLDANNFPIPGTYRNALAIEQTEQAVQPTAAVRTDWWTQYGSEELNRLVDRALAHNADLRVATLQVAQAKIRADQARAGRWPSLTAPVRAVVQGQGSSTDSQQNSQAGMAGAFRLDVWGEQRALVDSADMQLVRAVHERENVQRNTIGALVNAYIAYLSVSDSMLVARENEAVAAEILRSVEKRMALGDATADDLEQQRAVLFSQQVVLPGLENQQEDLRNTISRQVGALPGHLVLSEKGLDALQLPTVKTGLPSALLLGRPDIRMMEARMRAANANIDVARARLLPPVDLSAQVGYTGATLASLLQPQNFVLNTAAALVMSIFDGGVKQGEKAFAQSYYQEMVETYGKTVLQAVRDVESALANLKSTGRRLEAQKAVTRSALNLFKIGSDAFAVGAIDQSGLLQSRRNYQRSADETQRAKAELLRAYANLSYALGLGAVLNEAAEEFAPGKRLQTAFAGDLRVGPVDGRPVLLADALTPSNAIGQWEVELPGVFHRSSLLPLWRDLDARYASVPAGAGESAQPWIRAAHLDHIEGGPQNGEAWYRVFVTGFKEQKVTTSYCDTLLQAGQGCKVVPDPRGGQKSSFLGRSQ
jgi:NodT family efflux transporter outer membrane factor (OMF) lipoprotein